MNERLSPTDWENYFHKESLKTEELIASGDFSFLNKSRLRIALENKILSWENYTKWIQSQNNYAKIKEDLPAEHIDNLILKHRENKSQYKKYDIWSEDLIALESWDNHIIVLGLIPTDSLRKVSNSIFILCAPSILDQIIQTEFKITEEENNANENNSDSTDYLFGIDPDLKQTSDLDFSKITMNAETKPEPKNLPTAASVWQVVENKYQLHSDTARKQFEAYIVLKIINGKTKILKMDEDLVKENLNSELFTYNLKDMNPFSQVYRNGTSQSFNLEQFGFSILDFKYACVTPLKRGQDVLGFLVGFKIAEPNQSDKNILEAISNESAA